MYAYYHYQTCCIMDADFNMPVSKVLGHLSYLIPLILFFVEWHSFYGYPRAGFLCWNGDPGREVHNLGGALRGHQRTAEWFQPILQGGQQW